MLLEINMSESIHPPAQSTGQSPKHTREKVLCVHKPGNWLMPKMKRLCFSLSFFHSFVFRNHGCWEQVKAAEDEAGIQDGDE